MRGIRITVCIVCIAFMLLPLSGCGQDNAIPTAAPASSEPAATTGPAPETAEPPATPSEAADAPATEELASSPESTKRMPFILPTVLPDEVAIYIGNALYTVVPFDTPDVIIVDQGDGRVNEITLDGEKVYMSHSTCEGQDCTQQEPITPENYQDRLVLLNYILCLPNQVTVEYIPEREE